MSNVTTEGRRSSCPIALALDVLGDKWTLLIIRDMVFLGKQHFNELQAATEGIATNILSNRLKRLETDGIIHRRKDPDNKRRVVYSLTADKGMDLIPVLIELAYWGACYNESGMPEDILHRIKVDKAGYISEIRARLAQAQP